MPKIDLTITISVIVALAAIISPILTAIINNRHQLKLKKIEASAKEYERSILYKRKILESYLKHAGNCIVHSNHDSLHKYGKYYLQALLYVPESLAVKMISANKNYATLIGSLQPYKWKKLHWKSSNFLLSYKHQN